jgi:hypothetical protein
VTEDDLAELRAQLDGLLALGVVARRGVDDRTHATRQRQGRGADPAADATTSTDSPAVRPARRSMRQAVSVASG